MILDHVRGAAKKATREVANVVTLASTGLAGSIPTGDTAAMKLAAVNRCIEVISDSVGKMNSYAMQADTRERLFPPVLDLLNGRPNEAMTPFIRRKMLEINRLTRGNAYDWIVRNPITMEPIELIPLPAELVYPWQDTTGKIWYDVSHPYTGRAMRLPNEDVLHYKGYSRDGLHCLSVLQRAAQVIEAGLNAQGYQSSYYANGGPAAGRFIHRCGPGRLREGQGQQANGREQKRRPAPGVGEDPQRAGQRISGGDFRPRTQVHAHQRHDERRRMGEQPRRDGAGHLQLLRRPGL